MEIQFLGTGDAFGSGGRFNTCFHIRDQAGGFLIDCGASSMIAIRKFKVDPNAIRAILITHLHGDHFGGLPYFILDAQLVSRRTTPLIIAGPPGLKVRLPLAMENAFPGSTKVERRFRVEVRELEPRQVHEVAGVVVRPYVMKHACGAPPYALRINVDSKTICYSGDTEWVDELADAAQQTDLFIAESYFSDRPVKYHLDLATLVSRLPAIGAKRVILTHMSSEMLSRLGEIDCEAAHDGLVIAI